MAIFSPYIRGRVVIQVVLFSRLYGNLVRNKTVSVRFYQKKGKEKKKRKVYWKNKYIGDVHGYTKEGGELQNKLTDTWFKSIVI